jgi:hypothetical protein
MLPSYALLRDQLVQEGILVEEDDHVRLTKETASQGFDWAVVD